MAVIFDSFRILLGTVASVLPVVLFVLGFQVYVMRRPLGNVRRLAAGLVLTILGLALFLMGLEQTLFPIGRLMAEQLTHPELLGDGKDGPSYMWLYLFAVAIGFSTTIAEPALLAVAIKANDTSGGTIGVWGLRVAVAIGAATGVGLGCYRIISGAPLHLFIIAGYIVVVLQTIWAPRLIVPLAYDSGGVTTSTVTVPLIAALGLGLADAIPGRSVLLDGFGLVAIAALFPIISVLAYAQITQAVESRKTARRVRESRAEEFTEEVS